MAVLLLLLLLWLLLIRDRINCRWRWLAQNHEGVTNDLTHPEVLRVKFNGNHDDDDDGDIVARPLICLAQEICVWKSKVFPWTNIIKMHQIPCLPAGLHQQQCSGHSSGQYNSRCAVKAIESPASRVTGAAAGGSSDLDR